MTKSSKRELSGSRLVQETKLIKEELNPNICQLRLLKEREAKKVKLELLKLDRYLSETRKIFEITKGICCPEDKSLCTIFCNYSEMIGSKKYCLNPEISKKKQK